MRQRRTIASVAALATMGGSALLALATPSNAGPNTGPTSTKAGQQNYSLIAGTDGSIHALVPNTVLPRPSSVPANATPAALAKAYLNSNAQSFGVTNPSADLSATRTAKLGAAGTTVKFAQKLDGLPVLGGQLIVSMDAGGNLQSITGETASGSVSAKGHSTGTLKSLGQLDAITKARSFVNHAEGHPVTNLTTSADGTWVVNPQLVGMPNGSDINFVTTRYLVANADQSVSYSVYVNSKLGVIYGYNNGSDESSNHRLICDAHNTTLGGDDGLCQFKNSNVDIVRKEDGKKAALADANQVYDNLGLTQLTYARYTHIDATKLIGLSNYQLGLTANKTKQLRATVRICDPGVACPELNAHWSPWATSKGVVGGSMFYGEGVTTKDVTAHELSHGVTQQTSGLFYAYQSGAINESLSDTFGEITDLTNKIKGNQYDEPKYDWLIGEGTALGVIRSMAAPEKVPANVGNVSNFSPQPSNMRSGLWSAYKPSSPYWDEGGVHTNSGVGNKAAYLIAHGDTFGGQTIKGIGYAKTFKIYWSVENLLSSGADYKDLAVTLPLACKKQMAAKSSYLTKSDCAQVKKATLATKMYDNAKNNPPVATPYCPAGKKVKASLSQGFDSHKNAPNWTGLLLARTDYGIDNVNTGADAAVVVGQAGASTLATTKPMTVPTGSWLRFDYDLLSDSTATLQYRLGPSGAWKAMPKASSTVNAGPWTGSPGWSSAKYNLSPLTNKKAEFRFSVKSGSGTYFNANVAFLDNFKIYSCS